MLSCPLCGHENQGDARFCAACGASHWPEVLCPSCSRANPAGANFCNDCGRGLSDPQPSQDARQSLEQSQALLLESLRGVVYAAKPFTPFRCVWISRSIRHLTGFVPGDFVEQAGFWASRLHPDDRERVLKEFEAILTESFLTSEYRWQCADGSYRWFLDQGMLIRDESGKPKEIVGTWLDITERKRVEEELRESEERYRRLTENSYDLIAELDQEGRFVYVSPNYRESLGYEPESLLGKISFELVHPDDLEYVQTSFQNMIPFRSTAQGAMRLRHQEGSWRWLEVAGNTFTAASGEVRTVCISRDITDRKRAEDALQANEERYRLLAENAGDLVAELNAEGLYEYVSPSYQTVLGYAPGELLGHDAFEWIHPDDQEEIRAAIGEVVASGIPETKIYRSRRRDGEWRWLEAHGRALATGSGDTHLVVVMRDITERQRAEEEQRKLEAQVQQIQKLEGLGVLAGGIAHDFNNLLVPILGNVDLVAQELVPGSPARRFIERARTAALRASELTNSLLAYAGREKHVKECLDIRQILQDMAELLHTVISRKVELRYELADSLPAIEGDPAQLRQIIMNLITNASEAIRDEKGAVTVRAGTLDADRRYLSETYLGSGLPEGSYVYLEVHDSGCGMDEETRAKIFDPFFTTKFAGRGLGLATLVGIVRAHRGTLKVDSEPGRGTRFRLLFPCVSGAREAVVAEARVPLAWRGSGTILVVDDEEAVREILEEVIPRFGMSVVTARDGREAVERFRERAPEIAAVLLDVTMPALGGVEAFLEIRRIRSEARVILSSGYSEEDIAARLAGEEVNGFLHKPYRPEELIEKLRQILEG